MSDGTFNVYCIINSYLTILHIASVKSPNSMNLKQCKSTFLSILLLNTKLAQQVLTTGSINQPTNKLE